MIRVLHVVATGMRRGAEVFAGDLVRALTADGVEQRVVVLRSDDTVAVPYPAPVTVLASDGRRVPGIRIQPRILKGLGAAIRDWRPHVVQVHGGEPLKYAVLSSERAGAAVVYRRIGSAPDSITRGVRRAGHGRLMRRAARIVTVAEALRRQTVELFRLAPQTVVTIPNAADPSRMYPTVGRPAVRSSLGIPSAAKVILSLGALTREKDPLAHLEVTARMGTRWPELRHVFVGDGPLRAELEAAVRARGMEAEVLILGARPDVPNLLGASDLVLLASVNEGMPGCLIEAGMAGLPAAAFSVGGVPEVVEDGVTGVLASPGDTDGLSEGVFRLLADEAARRSMGEAARARCLSRFDIAAVAPRYRELYEEVSRTVGAR